MVGIICRASGAIRRRFLFFLTLVIFMITYGLTVKFNDPFVVWT